LVSVEVPNSASGPGLFVVFARASFDSRVMGFGICQFALGSEELTPNHAYLGLTPLSNQLWVEAKNPNATASCVYALSFSHGWNVTDTFNGNYVIPDSTGAGPVVLAAVGSVDGVSFVEWTAYPMVPFTSGADFSTSEANVFVYTVTVNGAFYRLTLRFGDVS